MSPLSSCAMIFVTSPPLTSLATCEIAISWLGGVRDTKTKKSTSIAAIIMTQTKLLRSHLLSVIFIVSSRSVSYLLPAFSLGCQSNPPGICLQLVSNRLNA